MYNDTVAFHTYNISGQYIVCLTVYDSLNGGALVCQNCDTISVGGVFQNCSFSSFLDTVNNVMIFASQPSSSSSTVSWDFGDGSSGIGTQVTHTYPGPGTYMACMIERDSNSTVLCTYCNAVTIPGIPPASCGFSVIPDSSGFSFSFSGGSSSSIALVNWTFGDNTTATGLNVLHTYNAPGQYQVCMTILDTNGIACTSCQYVTAGNPSGGCAITYMRDSVNTNIFYFGLITATGTTISWDFGDGSVGTGVSVTHAYTTTGTFIVCVTEADVFGTILCTSCITVVIGNAPGCQAYFMSTNLGLTGYFIDLSTFNSTATYSWDFGDQSTSTQQFPQHTYAVPGIYNVCLTVTGGGCTSTYCSSLQVDTLFNTPLFCSAYFVILQLAPFQVTVVNLSSGVNLNFNWDFGDGTTSNQPYPAHYYANTGSYNLCLTVSDTSGCLSTFCDTLSVDSIGNIFRAMNGFSLNVISPAALTGVPEHNKVIQAGTYPNPVQDQLSVTIASEMKGPVAYRLLSIDGSEVEKGWFMQPNNKLDAGKWNAGAYILEIQNAEGFRSYNKIIKE